LISGVRPPILDEEGVVAAIGHLVNEERRKKGPKIKYVSAVVFERLASILENGVYRIAQEALTNACKHSKSNMVRLQLVQHDDQLRIEIQDDGIGFKPKAGKGGFGLAGIRERARLLGGTATIASKPGKGTRIVVQLPIVLREEEK
jgi:signal transduction histidine kinase